MRLVMLVGAMALSGALSAQEYAMSWNVGSLDNVTVNDDPVRSMHLDISLLSRFLSVNGVIQTGTGFAGPVSGTCFVQSTGTAYCSMKGDSLTIILEIGPSLSGSITAYNFDSVQIDKGTISPAL